MKLIIAVVRPQITKKLIEVLSQIENFPGITIINAIGFGQQVPATFNQVKPSNPKKRLEIAAPDALVEEIVMVIEKHARTGKKGDGIIWVLPIEQTILI